MPLDGPHDPYLKILVLQLKLAVVKNVQILKGEVLDLAVVPRLVQQGPVDVLFNRAVHKTVHQKMLR